MNSANSGSSSGPPAANSSERRYEVIVVGAGPVGLAAANILAQAGHTVAIFESHATRYNLPRAGHIDNEVLRILQGMGCLAPVLDDAFSIHSVPLLDSDGEFLLELFPAHQTASSFRSVMMYQPVLEDALYGRLEQHGGRVTLFQGWTVDGAVSQDETGVQVCAHGEVAGAHHDRGTRFQCRYLIAADGAASSIRQAAGIEREDFGISERW